MKKPEILQLQWNIILMTDCDDYLQHHTYFGNTIYLTYIVITKLHLIMHWK